MSNKLLLNIGFGNFVVSEKIVAVIQSNSAPIKRYLKGKAEKNELIDATMGKRLKSVIVMSDGITVLSAISVPALSSRLENE